MHALLWVWWCGVGCAVYVGLVVAMARFCGGYLDAHDRACRVIARRDARRRRANRAWNRRVAAYTLLQHSTVARSSGRSDLADEFDRLLHAAYPREAVDAAAFARARSGGDGRGE